MGEGMHQSALIFRLDATPTENEREIRLVSGALD
jgi:hypothetical protein